MTPGITVWVCIKPCYVYFLVEINKNRNGHWPVQAALREKLGLARMLSFRSPHNNAVCDQVWMLTNQTVFFNLTSEWRTRATSNLISRSPRLLEEFKYLKRPGETLRGQGRGRYNLLCLRLAMLECDDMLSKGCSPTKIFLSWKSPPHPTNI